MGGRSTARGRSVLWRRLDGSGLEAARFEPEGRGWRLEGAVVREQDGEPSWVRYTVRCDAGWLTRQVEIEARVGPREASVELLVDAEGRWWSEGVELRELDSCHDVDLGFTPATNTLPIRRLGLRPGSGVEVTAACLRFPSFEIRPRDQIYRCLSPGVYRYQSDGGRFETVLHVDGFGVVTDYPGLWKMESSE